MNLHQINQYIRIGWRFFFIVLFIVLFFCSCDIQKEAVKSKSETEIKENIETITKRLGDTVVYIPNVRYKDTTIYTTNRQGTTLKTVYAPNGNIASIDCFASAIDEIKRENREFQQSLKDKEKVKTEDFDSSFILYIVIGVVIIFLFGLFLLFLIIRSKLIS